MATKIDNALEIIWGAGFTVLLGKNGAGKSSLLREIDAFHATNTKYISPERGGTLKYDPNVDNNMFRNENWIIEDRRKNRTEQFRQQSTAQFRNLEVMVLREIEANEKLRNDLSYKFDTTLKKINDLLPKVSLQRADRGFEIFDNNGQKIAEDKISSGESELIALCIEVLVFSRSSLEDKVLLLDEPDVHLHPDLQQKFIEFVEETARLFDFRVVLATHSTAIVGAFSRDADLQIVPISDRQEAEFNSFKYDPICHEILPIFGAHPLSSHFNREPVLLVEGEDDKRIFDQLVRSSQGQVKLTPCVVGTVDEMNKWEKWLNDFLPSIYDEPRAYSIRDLDNSEQAHIDDLGLVKRGRLNCYAVENLLLSKESLTSHGLSEEDFLRKIEEWIKLNPDHDITDELIFLKEHFSERRINKIKNLRNIIVALLGSTKPWEVLVGQLIASNLNTADSDPNSLYTYLGPKVINELLLHQT
ncbi:AAA family ATPase [Emcibacter sp.]|uniref:AAA family ATPase n=1 Tax=Emcibacter sp. TaxID=1979954 RepID=UPI002AA5E559|nr:AAA family ATPase [Emcibacter sp.]